MKTIQIYRKVSDTRFVQYTKNVSQYEQRRIFERYAKLYRLAYGYWPNAHSLSIEVKEYGGISIDTLNSWLNELKAIKL